MTLFNSLDYALADLMSLTLPSLSKYEAQLENLEEKVETLATGFIELHLNRDCAGVNVGGHSGPRTSTCDMEWGGHPLPLV